MPFTVADSIPQWIITQAQAEITKKAEQDALAAAGITDKQAQTEAAIDVLQQEMDQFREDQFGKWAQAEGEDISDETSLQAAKAKYNQLAARGEEGFHNGVYCPDSEDVNKWDIMNLKLRNLRNTSANIAAQNDAWSSEATKAAAAIYEREKDWNQEVGVPVELVDESTYETGSGGTTSSGSQSVIDGAVAWALKIANDEDGQTHGYSRANRNGPDYDCTSFCAWAYKTGGGLSDLFDKDTPGGDTFQEPFKKKGFKYMTYKEAGGKDGLKKGDIMLNSSHAEMFIGNGKLCGSHSSKTNKADEISVINFYENWTHVLRYVVSETATTSGDATKPSGTGDTGWEATCYIGSDDTINGGYGTAFGPSLRGKTFNAHYIAIPRKGDTPIWPYGTIVWVEFENEKIKKYNGEYCCADTGSERVFYADSKHIDIFVGCRGEGNTDTIYKELGSAGKPNPRFGGGIACTLYQTGKKITKEEAEKWRNPM